VSLPTTDTFEMYEGTAAGAVLAQLRAAGVRMIFHTNTSGFVPFWEAIDRAGDVQVINVTHEGHAVAAAQGYAMASRSLGFFFGSGAGVDNSMSNLYCAWKDRVPLLVTYSGGELSEQGKDGFESWDDTLRPTEPFTMWTANLLTDEMAEITRRAIRFAYGPPSGPVTMVWGTAQARRACASVSTRSPGEARHQFAAPPMRSAGRPVAGRSENPVFVVGPECSKTERPRICWPLRKSCRSPSRTPRTISTRISRRITRYTWARCARCAIRARRTS
jgi:thiamine pyrophosphate-dependent acetolactate synthase large subunit-like protein